ncbi:MAG: hypothetical protein HY592_02710 [Candidatus Omnitrophica bacterium]|nr:hypothetical protein [Candidatus Omnitrophota bacterium]
MGNVFIVKILIASCLIALASWLAGRRPVLAGFIIALPLTSILAILFAYWEHRDMGKINQFASSVFVAVPLSLTFFIPFLLNRWLKMNFTVTFCLSLALLAISYLFATAVLKIDLTK